MPTKYRRIAVTLDPKLAAALQEARNEMPGKSDAALVKELALRGSRAGVGSPSPALERILARPGVRPPLRNLDDVLSELDKSQRFDSETIDQILDEDRADREVI